MKVGTDIIAASPTEKAVILSDNVCRYLQN